ncbi:hypothetical protein [Actinomyces procaprae]|uniref:hypothetical protein n=1 Tax=Actinomyces procaprae TaxID=2560010 RepID=UPI00109DBF24|nr:hypothetical protein [Actinomyces procaprae]
MGSIPGYFEWDDDTLMPGRRKEGGLHQNLFDADGNLRGHARFVPKEDFDNGIFDVTDQVYVPTEERRLSPEQQELAEFIGEVLAQLLENGIELAKPHVRQWWQDSVRPFVGRQREKLARLRPGQGSRAEASQPESEVPEGNPQVTSPGSDIVASSGLKMARAEAQARYLAAMAAEAFSREQLSLVRSAEIVEADNVDESELLIGQLSPEQVRGLLVRMISNPRLLCDDSLADLASALSAISVENPEVGVGAETSDRWSS